MLDYVFSLFFMGFPGVQILVLVSSIFLAINRNKLNKRVYGLFFPIIITMCNIWLISIDRTELFDDALRFSFFLISFCFPMLISSTIYHSIRLYYLYKSIKWRVFPISICYLFGLIFIILIQCIGRSYFEGKSLYLISC